MFNPRQPCPTTPFTRKLNWYLQGIYDEMEAQDKEQFNGYIEKILEERLEEGDTNPVKYEPNMYYELELKSLNNIAFAVADNPFVKSDTPKFFPECYIVSGGGEIIGHMGPDSDHVEDENMAYHENFRDEALKVNDDRKIQLYLDSFEDPNACIFLMVRVNDSKQTSSKHYDQAWFRL
jgi:hypothetical protein